MYIRKSERRYKDKVYVSYVLVESVATPKGPRQKTICTLGSLEPRPAEEWLKLAHKVEDALCGQLSLEGSDAEVGEIVKKVRARQAGQRARARAEREELVEVVTSEVETEDVREVGAVHVGQQFYQRLGIDEALATVGLSSRTCLLTQVLVLNRLVAPSSEHAASVWLRGTAVDDLVGERVSALGTDALYRNLDRLYPKREPIEKALWKRERTLFSLEDTVYLYDLTSTYFEGRCPYNDLAQYGYSRDGRPDCKQVVIGLVIDREGFPKAHEIFPGNQSDGGTVEAMLDALVRRGGPKEGALVVVDRGMASPENLKLIRERKHHYVVALRQSERDPWLAEFEDQEGWTKLKPRSRSLGVRIRKRVVSEEEALVLCRSRDRAQKDREIREKQEGRLLEALQRLAERIDKGQLKDPDAIQRRIGRLQERFPRVARYWTIDYHAEAAHLSWSERPERRAKVRELDGAYLLRTSRIDMDAEEIWRTYTLLSRAENAFRAMKSPLAERPIFHQLQRRVETHIFLCVLAYHLLVAIEKALRDHGIHASWATVRQMLANHHAMTVVLPTSNGDVLCIRQASRPDPTVRTLYKALGVPDRPFKRIRTLYRMAPT